MFNLFKRDYVLLQLFDGRYLKRRVKWYCGVPFAAPYLPETRCRLLKGGKVRGQSYITGWLPASKSMEPLYGEYVEFL